MNTLSIDVHILQNFAPSNLNRDDNGAPKDAVFAGARRARISSQCSKRAIRSHFAAESELETSALGVRTKRIPHAVAEILAADHDPAVALEVAARVIAAAGLKIDEKTQKTATLVFLPKDRIRSIAGVVHESWTGIDKKTIPKTVTERVQALLKDATRTPDVAAFGRMIAEGDDWGVAGAVQTAQSLSTHAADNDFDFFTAVDDLQPKGETGSAHMDSSQFVASCQYRYATMNVPLLRTNLQFDKLVEPTAEAWLRAMVHAIPTGKQTSFAAHNPPSYVLVVAHEGQPFALTNAFAQPVRPREHDIVGESILALERYWARVHTMYGTRINEFAAACQDRDATRDDVGIRMVPSVDAVIETALNRVRSLLHKNEDK